MSDATESSQTSENSQTSQASQSSDAKSATEDRLARLANRKPKAHGIKIAAENTRATVSVCEAAGCLSLNSDKVVDAITEKLQSDGISDVAVKRVGCLGLCADGPLTHIPETNTYIGKVSEENITPVIDAVAKVTQLTQNAQDPQVAQTTQDTSTAEAAPFYSRQQKIALEYSGVVDPEDIDDYISRGGFSALQKALNEMQPQQVIDEVTKSGLRGRGGAGFPTGLKWTTVAKSPNIDGKFTVCNADEGDPGAFMDRAIIESDPFRILEGMAIAAYAVGANEGYVYCRAEYPLAVKRLKSAIRAAERKGFLGQNICGTQFDFKLDVRLGAGAFVCGEETALLRSIEGNRGTPVPRPPFPAVKGLKGKPTLLNNVETYANIAPIIRNGGDWYAGIGVGKSKGTKVFALAGRVKNTGLVEVPMGTSLREIVYDIGGGIIDDRPFKAVQTGGPSGGCIPAEYLDMSVDYESLAEKGSIVGSGGMIVMDDTSCMVDVAKFFMDFCVEESCGKCTPCRVGTSHMHALLEKMTEGHAHMGDLAQLEKLAGMVKATSLCGLGQTAPNPVFSTLKYFRDEYLAHIEEKRCPAGVCPINDKEAALV